MKKVKYFTLAFLITSASCSSLDTTTSESFVTYLSTTFFIGPKIVPLALLSATYEDSLGYWPSSLDSLNEFYLGENKSELAADSLYNSLNFNVNEFESIEFLKRNKILKINFETTYLEDGLNPSVNEKDLHYWKAIGSMIVFPRIADPDSLKFEVEKINMRYFDARMREKSGTSSMGRHKYSIEMW